MMENQLIHGDCLEVMPQIPDQSIGFIVTDLPYGVTACKWDVRIDLDALWVQFKRLIQPKRAIALTATQPFTTDLIISNRECFKYEIIWEKTVGNNFLNANREPIAKHENILIFGAQGWLHYTPQKQEGEPYVDKPRNRTHNLIRDCRIPKLGIRNEGNRYPSSVIKYANGNNGVIHPTQKPIALYEYLIRTYSNPGDTILDCTAGSMTAAIAAINTDRRYICIEKDPEYYRKGCDRVNEHLARGKQLSLLEPVAELRSPQLIQMELV